MTNDLIIHARERDLGGFVVHRSLPDAQRRHLGPFVFLDHMGPMRIDEKHVMDVRPHPHIGLSTVTYLFSGRGFHRDNIGSKQLIAPGDLNWMTAGQGIVHSERTPNEDRKASANVTMHGVQIWVALPLKDEDCTPSFTHWSKEKLPKIELTENLTAKLLLGKHGKTSSPVYVHSPILFMDVQCGENINDTLSFEEDEIGVFLVEGACTVNGQTLEQDDLIVVADPKSIKIEVQKGTRILILGGEPFPEPRYIWWNFVSSSKDKIHKAAHAWKNQEFEKVPGETEFIPLPEYNLP